MQLSMDPDGDVILFGGCQLYLCLSDTWTWDGTVWTEQHPAERQSIATVVPRHGLGHRPWAGRAVRRGRRLEGYYGFTDTWVWDGSTWTCVDGCS
jgi:hypothetical protein